MDYLVTRHKGALEWLRQKVGAEAVYLPHLEDVRMLNPGDTVYGTLPVNRIAEICTLRAHYFHLLVDIPAHLRGKELTSDQLDQLGARLVEFIALRPICDESILKQAQERESFYE